MLDDTNQHRHVHENFVKQEQILRLKLLGCDPASADFAPLHQRGNVEFVP